LLERIFPSPEFVWKEKAQFYSNGKTAIITGEIVNLKSKNSSLKVYIKLVGPTDWKGWKAAGGSWFAFTTEADKTAKAEHESWMFWQLSDESYLEGTGDIDGKIYLKKISPKLKTAFQFGKGANAMDSDLGLGGYFSYSGKLKVKGKIQKLYGIGSMTVDAIPCADNCFPVPETIKPEISLKTVDEFIENSGITLYPVPAKNRLTLNADESVTGRYEVIISDLSGKVKHHGQWNVEEGNQVISLDGFRSGIYIIQLITGQDEVITKSFIIDQQR
jgi:hypothetical protein